MAKIVVARGLNVRQTEKLAQKQPIPPRPTPDAELLALEKQITDLLGMKIRLRTSSSHAGELTVRYDSLDQFDDLLYRLSGGRLGRDHIEPDPEDDDSAA